MDNTKIPYEIKQALIEKAAIKLYGKDESYKFSRDWAVEQRLEKALQTLTKTVKKNIIKRAVDNLLVPNEYWALGRSGMLYEFFPKFTGNLGQDREEFTEFYMERGKPWVDEILKPR